MSREQRHAHRHTRDHAPVQSPVVAAVLAAVVAVALAVAALTVAVAHAATGTVADDCVTLPEARSAYVGDPFRPWLNTVAPDRVAGTTIRWHADRVRDVQACRWRTDLLRVHLMRTGPQIAAWRWLRCDGSDCTVIERWPTP